MGLKEDLDKAVKEILQNQWTIRDGQVVPEPEDLGLANDAVSLEGTVLYADIVGSTTLVDTMRSEFAAEVYKAYMVCMAQIIKAEGGTITAYDGDRVMALFIGDSKNSTAARTALKMNWALRNILNPAIVEQYGNEGYEANHVVGIDTSPLHICRIGVRNDNDLVWVGRAANYAAKLTALNEGYPTYITGGVFDKLHDKSKYGGPERKLMWEQRTWSSMNSLRIYRSNWWWGL